MICISHRGNIFGRNPKTENKIKQIEKCFNLNFFVEIDVWCIDNKFVLSHDEPNNNCDTVSEKWLKNDLLWCHAKNLEALRKMLDLEIHCFWHQNDSYTLTSDGHIWVYPDQPLTEGCVSVDFDLKRVNEAYAKNCIGICSDYIGKIST